MWSIGYLLCVSMAIQVNAIEFSWDGCECTTVELDTDGQYRIYSSYQELGICEEAEEETSSHE